MRVKKKGDTTDALDRTSHGEQEASDFTREAERAAAFVKTLAEFEDDDDTEEVLLDEGDEAVDEDREAADDEDLAGLDKTVPLTFTEQDIREAILALEKVRCSCTPIAVDANVSHFQILKISNKVWNNTTIRHELEKLAKEAGLGNEVLIRAVKTRWNTVALVLKRAREMRNVIPALLNTPQLNNPKQGGIYLRQYTLSTEEWVIIDQLYELLNVRVVLTSRVLQC